MARDGHRCHWYRDLERSQGPFYGIHHHESALVRARSFRLGRWGSVPVDPWPSG